MLIEFSVGNYLSFKDIVTFSMVASGISQHKETHFFKAKNYNLLKSAALYGANASGKSNLFNAMRFARTFIIHSSKDTQAKEEINVEKFLLSTETENEPSFFEFVFIKNNIKYRYGFRVNKTEIVDEWLFRAKKNKEEKLFERNYQDINVEQSFSEGKGLEAKTRGNALFLSVVSQFNGEISKSIIDWLLDLNVISGLEEYIPISINMFKNKEFKKQFVEILKIADLAIEEFKIKPINVSKLPKHIQLQFEKIKEKKEKIELLPEIKTIHKKFNEHNEFNDFVEFDLEENESQGTQNLFSILGPILDTLNEGKVLVVDEFDVNLHPLITIFLIKLFNSNKNNSNNAQLVFNTHDTNLLNKELFRRDQIWFAEKDEYGSTDLFSLIEYKEKVRHDRSFAKDYLAGKYGAIPFIGAYDFFCEEGS